MRDVQYPARVQTSPRCITALPGATFADVRAMRFSHRCSLQIAHAPAIFSYSRIPGAHLQPSAWRAPNAASFHTAAADELEFWHP